LILNSIFSFLFRLIQIEAVDLNCAMPLELLAMADRGELQYSLVYV